MQSAFEINVFPIFSTIAFLLLKVRSCYTHSTQRNSFRKTIILILRVHDLTFNLFVRKSFKEIYSETSLLLKVQGLKFIWHVFISWGPHATFVLGMSWTIQVCNDVKQAPLYLRLSRIEQFTRKLIEAMLNQRSFCTWNVYRITLSFCLESNFTMMSMVGVHFVGR